jgi:hypothetical protein
MELGTAMLWSIADALSRIVRQERSALLSMWWAYAVWGRELDPNAEVCAHLASDGSFKHIVGVKLEDLCERA